MATLKVTVHEARDLPIMDRTTGLADPYVVVKLDDMEHTTDIARRTRNPVWEHDVRFDTADLLVLQEDPLEIRVYDHDIISRDDIVGMVLLDCNSIIYRANPAVSGWFPLIDSDAGLHGDIRLTIRIKFHAAENPLAPALPERYVRRLDPRAAVPQSPSPPPPPQQQQQKGQTSPGGVALQQQQQQLQPSPLSCAQANASVSNVNEISISLSTMPSVMSHSAALELPLATASHYQQQQQQQQAGFSSPSVVRTSNRNGVATAASPRNAGASVSLSATTRTQTQVQRASTSAAPSAAFYPMNVFDSNATNTTTAAAAAAAAAAMQLASPSLLPFLVEQDLDPLQAARVNHPTLAAEEEGVFIFSVWRLDPAVFRVESTHSMMEELIVKADPEHVRFTNLRSSRSINDARVIQLFKLSGKVRRQLARKVVELQCNAVLGYVEEFDMEPNGIIVRAYGTPCVVSQVKYVDALEMQSYLRSKTRYLQSSVAAAYQSELAQLGGGGAMTLSSNASPLLSTGATTTSMTNATSMASPQLMSAGSGSVAMHPGGAGPTYFPPPHTILPTSAAPSGAAAAGGGVTAAMGGGAPSASHLGNSATMRSPLPLTPLLQSAALSAAGIQGGADVAESHLLPPPMLGLANDSVTTTYMPPDRTSTAVQSPATTPVLGAVSTASIPVVQVPPLGMRNECDADSSVPSLTLEDPSGQRTRELTEGGALMQQQQQQYRQNRTNTLHQQHPQLQLGVPPNASFLAASPSYQRGGVGGTTFDGAASTGAMQPADALMAAVVSASMAGTPTYLSNTPDMTSTATTIPPLQQQPVVAAASALGANRTAKMESSVVSMPSVAGLNATTTTAAGPAGGGGAAAAAGSAASAPPPGMPTALISAVTAPARVMISILTVKDLPAGAIHHIGGYICARSVKIVSRVKSRQMISQERDAWWMELREELRANARAFHCNTVLGYEEETQYHEDVVLLSLYGTAVMLDISVPALRAGPEFIFRRQRQRVAAKRSCTLLHLYEGPRRKNGQQGLGGLLAGEVGDLLMHHVCTICHHKPVPEVLLAACTLPVELSCEAPPRLVQVAVSKPKPSVKGVELAMAVSQALPFIEFALHKQLLFNLRLQQMNACFALRVSIVVGPDAIIGTLTGSGCRLAGLPVPRLPRMTVVDPLIANRESVVKLRDVIASRRRRLYNEARNSSSSSSSSSSSTRSSSSSSSSRSSSSSASSNSSSPSFPYGVSRRSKRAPAAPRHGSGDELRAAAAAGAGMSSSLTSQPQHPGSYGASAANQNNNSANTLNSGAGTPRSVTPTQSVSTSRRRKSRRNAKAKKRHHRERRSHSRHPQARSDRHRSTGSSREKKGRDDVHDDDDNEGGEGSGGSAGRRSARSRECTPPASTAGASFASGGGGGADTPEPRRKPQQQQQHQEKRHRHRHSRRRTRHNTRESSSSNARQPTRSVSVSGTASRSASSSSASSRSSRLSYRLGSSSRSGSGESLHSWVPTESSETDEDVYAAADEWHTTGSGVRARTNDYVVKIDDVEEADMMLGMVDLTKFEDGVLLTLPYVPDSANAFDLQERIVLDRRYSRASASPHLGGGGGANNNNSSLNGTFVTAAAQMNGNGTANNGGSYGYYNYGARNEGGQDTAHDGGGGGGAPVIAATAGRTALTTRLLNEYCADAKRAFVHRACRMAMRTGQPLRLRVVNVRVEMMFVPNSADLQLRLEGCVMVATSAGARQLRALEDRAFRVCMHHTFESLSGMWQSQQQQMQMQMQSQTSHSNTGVSGGGGRGSPSQQQQQRPTNASMLAACTANVSGKASPSGAWGPDTPVLSPMAGAEAVYAMSTPPTIASPNPNYVNNNNNGSSSGGGGGVPGITSAAAVAALRSKMSLGALPPLAESGPAYLDARRLFVTTNAPFSMPYVQDITLPPPRVWSGAATAFSEDAAAPPRHTSTYTEYRDSRGSRTATLSRRWHAFVRATGQSIKGLVDRATGGAGDRIDRRLQQQRRAQSSNATDGLSSTVLPDGGANPSMDGLRDANYSHPAARLPHDMAQLAQLIPVVLFTPLDYVAGRSIVRYLGRLSQHFIREDYNTDTGDDLIIFFQRAEMEMISMVQAVVRLMGGNALLKHRVVYHEICDSDGSGTAFLFATVTGDVVQVSDVEYWGTRKSDAGGTGKKKRGAGGGYSKHSQQHHQHQGSAHAQRSPYSLSHRAVVDGEDAEDSEGHSTPPPPQLASSAQRQQHSSWRRRNRRGHRRRHDRERHRHRRSASSSSATTHSSSSSSRSESSEQTVSSSTTADSATPADSRSGSGSSSVVVAAQGTHAAARQDLHRSGPGVAGSVPGVRSAALERAVMVQPLSEKKGKPQAVEAARRVEAEEESLDAALMSL